MWSRSWIQRRQFFGQYKHLMKEMESEDVGSYRNFIRMDSSMFQEQLHRVGLRIEKQDTFLEEVLGTRAETYHHPVVLSHRRNIQVIAVQFQSGPQHH